MGLRSVTSGGIITRGHTHPRIMLQRSSGSPLARFFSRYKDRTLIIHRGFPPNWLGELLKQPGGGGHFRIDVTQIQNTTPTPVEWLIHQFILPLELPLPLLIQVVNDDTLFVRHLLRDNRTVHPSELILFLEEMNDRHHFCLSRDGASLQSRQGIPLTDNEARAMLDNL